MGTYNSSTPKAGASSAMGKTPFTARTSPLRETSPIKHFPRKSAEMFPMLCKIPIKMARSCMVPLFFTSAGAKFTVMRLAGSTTEMEFSAERMRSRLSRTDASGSPTISKCGCPRQISTSTSTENAFNPNSPRLLILETILHLISQKPVCAGAADSCL